jgi:GTP-binding protein HflX
VLVGVQLSGVSDEEHAADLAELGRLVRTLGYDVGATLSQRRDSLAPAAVVGEGKLKELAELTGGDGVIPSGATPRKSKARARRSAGEGAHAEDDRGEEGDDPSGRPALVVVDHEITPTQARNLERATGASVLDRSGVIVEIFHRHAKSREARLQVEIARLNYVAPRLRESANSERQAGRGAGESALELDRRKVRDRIAELKEELEVIQKRDDSRRKGREGQLRVALVGYTNAGKSSLMRALTGSDVLVQDKVFATLDTTVRALQPETKPRILVSDTVGFIKKLPHDLVASFRSTLDEAHEASLLLYVVDASDPAHEAQLEVTRTVLGEIGAGAVPSKLVLNKCDRLDEEARDALRQAHPDAILLSARDPADIATLRQTITRFFEEAMADEELLIPYDKQRLLGAVYEEARVLSEEYDERGARLRVRALPATLERLRHLVASGDPGAEG